MCAITNIHAGACLANVTAGYRTGLAVLDRLSATFDSATVTHVAGPNGSGKSTLVELLSGYLAPWGGEVRIGGQLAQSKAARERRRVVRSHAALYGEMTVRDHLAFAARNSKSSLSDLLMRAERLGLFAWIDHNARDLSTGNARKLWYLFCTPGFFNVLVLDEPFNGVDDAGVAVMCSEIASYRDSDSCVIITSHTLPATLKCDAVFQLRPVPAVSLSSQRGI